MKKNEDPPFDPLFPELSRPKPRPKRRGRWIALVVVLLLAGGGAVAWKMLGSAPWTAGGTGKVDPAPDVMRAELMELSAAESAYVKANGRYAASVSDLGVAVTSKVAIFATAEDGYHVRLTRPETEQRCEVSAGRFAAGHSGWQLLCGVPAANDALVAPEPPKPSLIDRVRAFFHEDCDSECRVEKLREEVHRRRGTDKLDKALEQL